MKSKVVEISIYDKREMSTSTFEAEQLSENKFRMIDNDVFNCCLTKGTEFKTRINKDGKHEIIKILKDSEFITRRFFLSPQYNEYAYRVLGNELIKRGGFWQIDFGGIATINIPKNFEFNVDQVMKELDLNLTEIID